jgi:hypothetical protein
MFQILEIFSLLTPLEVVVLFGQKIVLLTPLEVVMFQILEIFLYSPPLR